MPGHARQSHSNWLHPGRAAERTQSLAIDDSERTTLLCPSSCPLLIVAKWASLGRGSPMASINRLSRLLWTLSPDEHPSPIATADAPPSNREQARALASSRGAPSRLTPCRASAHFLLPLQNHKTTSKEPAQRANVLALDGSRGRGTTSGRSFRALVPVGRLAGPHPPSKTAKPQNRKGCMFISRLLTCCSHARHRKQLGGSTVTRGAVMGVV